MLKLSGNGKECKPLPTGACSRGRRTNWCSMPRSRSRTRRGAATLNSLTPVLQAPSFDAGYCHMTTSQFSRVPHMAVANDCEIDGRNTTLHHCMANLTVYLLKVSDPRRVDRHLRYPGNLRRNCFQFNWRHCNKGYESTASFEGVAPTKKVAEQSAAERGVHALNMAGGPDDLFAPLPGRGLHSFPIQLNLRSSVQRITRLSS